MKDVAAPASTPLAHNTLFNLKVRLGKNLSSFGMVEIHVDFFSVPF